MAATHDNQQTTSNKQTMKTRQSHFFALLFFISTTSFLNLNCNAQTTPKPIPSFTPEYYRLLKLENQPQPQKKDGKYGYVIYPSKKVVIPYIYKDASKFNNGFAIVKNDTGAGVINIKGEIVIPFNYTQVGYFNQGLFIAQKGLKHWGIIDSSNKTVIPFEYEEIQSLPNRMIAAKKNGNLGLISISNNVILPFDYFGIREIADSIYELTCNGNYGKHGFFFFNSKIKLDCIYTSHPDFNFKPTGIESENKRGIIDKRGNFLFPLTKNVTFLVDDDFRIMITDKHKFIRLSSKWQLGDTLDIDSIRSVSYGQIKVRKNNKWGIINTTGKWLIPIKFDGIERIINGRVAVKINDKWGFADTIGNIIIPANYQKVEDFYEMRSGFTGLAVVQQNNKWGIIDKQNKVITPIIYDHLSTIHNTGIFTLVMQNGLYGFLGTQGKEVFPCIEKELFFPMTKLTPIQQSGKWGYTNSNKDIVIPCIYDEVSDYNTSGTRVKCKGKWGFVDGFLKTQIDFTFDEAEDFKKIGEGIFAKVKKGNETYFVDPQGNKYK